MAGWVFEVTDGREIDDPVRALAESLMGLTMHLHAIHRHSVELRVELLPALRGEAEFQPEHGDKSLLSGALASATVALLDEIDDHLEHLQRTDAWFGQLAEIGHRFRSAYGQVKDVRDVMVHRADYILGGGKLPDLRDWWYFGPGISWSDSGLRAVDLFGRRYEMAESIEIGLEMSLL